MSHHAGRPSTRSAADKPVESDKSFKMPPMWRVQRYPNRTQLEDKLLLLRQADTQYLFPGRVLHV